MSEYIVYISKNMLLLTQNQGITVLEHACARYINY